MLTGFNPNTDRIQLQHGLCVRSWSRARRGGRLCSPVLVWGLVKWKTKQPEVRVSVIRPDLATLPRMSNVQWYIYIHTDGFFPAHSHVTMGRIASIM